MSLKIAIQMDPLININFKTDTTILLAYEAYIRGYELYYYLPANLSLHNNQIITFAQKLTFGSDKHDYKLDNPFLLSLNEVDVILMRQDPPFDMHYITATYFLEYLDPKILVVNKPTSVRNSPEKIFVHRFGEFMPPTLITRNLDLIKNFRNNHGEVVLKPLYCFGGQDIIHLTQTDDNINSLVDMFLKLYSTPLIIQKYLSEVKFGDKRVILINGEVEGACSRIPESGRIVSNIAAGGTARATKLTAHEQHICSIIGLELKKHDIFLAGLDLIGNYITEINVTSPTSFISINKFNNIKLEAIFWDKVLELQNKQISKNF